QWSTICPYISSTTTAPARARLRPRSTLPLTCSKTDHGPAEAGHRRDPRAPTRRAPALSVVSAFRRTVIVSLLAALLPLVARLGGEPRVLDGDPDREVIEALKRVIADAEHVVDRIVVETADAGAPGAGGFGLEIQHLADHTRFPEQAAIERRPESGEARVEVGQHAEAEEAVGGDVLIAAQTLRLRAAVAAREQEERQRVMRAPPEKLGVARLAQPFQRRTIAHEQIKSRLHFVDAVNEQRQVNPRVPPQRIPRRGLSRHRALQDREEAVRGDRRGAVERDGAAPLQDELARVRRVEGSGMVFCRLIEKTIPDPSLPARRFGDLVDERPLHVVFAQL